MTTKPQLGKNVYRDELAKGRLALEALRRTLEQLVDETGQLSRSNLIAKAAIEAGKLEAVLSRLDEIGRNAKNLDN